jgi:hypothetical protein
MTHHATCCSPCHKTNVSDPQKLPRVQNFVLSGKFCRERRFCLERKFDGVLRGGFSVAGDSCAQCSPVGRFGALLCNQLFLQILRCRRRGTQPPQSNKKAAVEPQRCQYHDWGGDGVNAERVFVPVGCDV